MKCNPFIFQRLIEIRLTDAAANQLISPPLKIMSVFTPVELMKPHPPRVSDLSSSNTPPDIIPFLLPAAPQCQTGAEATSALRATAQCITPRRCSATARASTSAASSVVSPTGRTCCYASCFVLLCLLTLSIHLTSTISEMLELSRPADQSVCTQSSFAAFQAQTVPRSS